MIYTKQYIPCGICKKELVAQQFDKHLTTHFNPLGRNCTAWYQAYFKRDRGVCVCKICDEEVHSFEIGNANALAYEGHLRVHEIHR